MPLQVLLGHLQAEAPRTASGQGRSLAPRGGGQRQSQSISGKHAQRGLGLGEVGNVASVGVAQALLHLSFQAEAVHPSPRTPLPTHLSTQF